MLATVPRFGKPSWRFCTQRQGSSPGRTASAETDRNRLGQTVGAAMPQRNRQPRLPTPPRKFKLCPPHVRLADRPRARTMTAEKTRAGRPKGPSRHRSTAVAVTGRPVRPGPWRSHSDSDTNALPRGQNLVKSSRESKTMPRSRTAVKRNKAHKVTQNQKKKTRLMREPIVGK